MRGVVDEDVDAAELARSRPSPWPPVSASDADIDLARRQPDARVAQALGRGLGTVQIANNNRSPTAGEIARRSQSQCPWPRQ